VKVHTKELHFEVPTRRAFINITTDIDRCLAESRLAHNGYEDNADAHLKRQIMGREVVVTSTQGELHLGTWEQIFYGEFDGIRKKRALVKIIGE
jgi:thiamine phosphate synthase YjbQ (UPF0047 family)